MTFVFQQPGTSPLLDAIEECAAGCTDLGGMFAFATKEGAKLFLDLPEVQAVLACHGRVYLVVGLDAITNGEALLFLRERIEASEGRLEVKAYLHPWPGTFHPKYMWFVREDEVEIIAGSGNLTLSGLGCVPAAKPTGNWEAFLVQTLDHASSAHFLESIADWITRASDSGYLLDVNDPRVLARGAANSRVRLIRPPRENVTAEVGQEAGGQALVGRGAALPPIVPWPTPPDAAPERRRVRTRTTAAAGDQARQQKAKAGILDGPRGELPPQPVRAAEPEAFVREISKNRAGQADLGKEGLQFFGFSGNENSSVLLQFVGLNNVVGEPVERNLFVNASKNRRVEMPEIAELDYETGPDGERMILVAVRLDERTFRYVIVPITHLAYVNLSTFLSANSVARNGQMRKAFVHASELETAWPEGPSNLFPVSAISMEA